MSDTLRLTVNRRYGTLSPLRYPGGKATLAGLFEDVFSALNLDLPTYVEPYAGGAGAGIALLREGLIERLVINDIDPAVNAFWNVILGDTDRFIKQISSIPLTVDEWRRQRETYRMGENADKFDLGIAFFYLNRTNRSGILNAGVIGGLDQNGNYKIDARFNRDTLVSRIAALGELSDRIDIHNEDGRTIISEYGSNENTFLYIDPPYVDAGSKLYLNAFDGRDHQALADIVQQVEIAHWLVTYDVSSLIRRLYTNSYQCQLDLTYSANRKRKAQELLIASPTVAAALSALQQAQIVEETLVTG